MLDVFVQKVAFFLLNQTLFLDFPLFLRHLGPIGEILISLVYLFEQANFPF